MNCIKRAFLSVTRRWMKTLILVVVFSVIAALLFCGISISNAAQSMVNEAKNTVGSEVTVAWNTDKNSEIIPIKSEQFVSLTKQPQIKDYNIANYSNFGVSDGFTAIGNQARMLSLQKTLRDSFAAIGNKTLAKTALEPNLMVYGVRKSPLSDQFISGGYKLVCGRPLTERDLGRNFVLVSKQLADKNRLKNGDQISLNCCYKKTHCKFTIVGMFTSPKPANSSIADCCELNPYNYIFMPYTQIGLLDKKNQYKPYNPNSNVTTVNFYINDPANVAPFSAYAKKMVGANYKVQSNDDLYETVVQPLCGVASAAQLLTLLTLLAGGLIFALIIVFSMRGRGREFGILLSVGEKRARILLQMLFEVILPILVAFFVGAATGNYISGRIGDNMLSQKAAVVQQQQYSKYISQFKGTITTYHGYAGKATIASPISKIDLSVSPQDYGMLAAACLLLALISVCAPCISVLRFNPRQILTQK